MFPAQVEDFSQPGTGENQEAKRRSSVGRQKGALVFFLGKML
jgi:hypothetical protein